MAPVSSSRPLLSGGQSCEFEDVPGYLPVPGRSRALSSHDHIPHNTRHLAAVFQVITFSLAVWGLISLGLEASSALHARQKPKQTSQIPLPSWSQYQQADYKIDVYRPATLPPGLSLCDCGTTIQEALSRDCAYDTLSTAWLPPYCRDDELTAEFDRAGPGPEGAWEYFADEEGKLPLNVTQMAALGETGGSFWASRDWHIVHCLFYWQKYVRMRSTNLVMEERFDSLHHVKHCGRLIRNPIPDHFFLIEVPVMMNSSKDV